AAAIPRPQAVRRPYPEPRLRRSRNAAPGRLAGVDGARSRRQLRADAPEPDRPCQARSPLVPGQHAAYARAAGPRPASTESPAPVPGHHVVSGLAVVAGLPARRHRFLRLAHGAPAELLRALRDAVSAVAEVRRLGGDRLGSPRPSHAAGAAAARLRL